MGHEFSSLLYITDNGLKKWILVGNLGNMVLEIMWQPCLINYFFEYVSLKEQGQFYCN